MGDEEMHTKFLSENLKVTENTEDVRRWKIILEWIYRNRVGSCGLGVGDSG
jgi:hypothetical protein